MQNYALQASFYGFDVDKKKWLPEKLPWQSRIIIAISFRKNAEKQPNRAGYWRSRARYHEIQALKLTGRPLPPVGYDRQPNWQQRYFDWIVTNELC